jgi:hypothetical protein
LRRTPIRHFARSALQIGKLPDGQKRDLKKRIESLEERIREHRAKISSEGRKAHPDDGLIRFWEREISNYNDEIERKISKAEKGLVTTMAKSRATAGISLHALETIVEEVITDGVPAYDNLIAKLRRAKRGTQAYQDVLSELWVAADVLKVKAEAAMQAIDEYTETLPD